MMEIKVIHTGTGGAVVADFEALMLAYGAHAIRISSEGAIFLLMAEAEEGEWINVIDAELVQPAGKPSKARKQ